MLKIIKKMNESYQLIMELGRGTYGKATLVRSNLPGQKFYVMKTINIENMSENNIKKSFEEVNIIKKLNHPNIIKFHELILSKNPIKTINMIVEYADGGDLSQKIKKMKNKKKYFEESEILDYFIQICLALYHMHSKYILHRDLKSQNIFLTKKGLVKIGDFGVAKNLQNTWKKASTMIGTPYYLSPEIVLNKPYSFESDIWSLGVLLYEMMALKMPFDAISLPMLTLKIMKGEYPPPPKIYSEDLRKLVSSLLNVNPQKRPNINQVLKFSIIRNRIISVLNENQFNKEFSVSIVKNYKMEKKK